MLIFQTIPTVGVLAGGTTILFEGGLRAGAERDFKNKLESTPHAGLLHIESRGGRAKEGMRIGRMIYKAGLVTSVSTHCESAATFMFISGKERLERGAKIGFHRPSGGWNDDGDGRNVRQFMKEAGIAEDFINRVIATSADDMWYPTYEEILQAGVVTGVIVNGKPYRSMPETEDGSPTVSKK